MFYRQGSVTGNLGFVFMNPVTQAPYSMRQPSMKLMLKRLCEKAGVIPFGFHAIATILPSVWSNRSRQT